MLSHALNIEIAIAVFKFVGKISDENDKLIINDIGLLSAV